MSSSKINEEPLCGYAAIQKCLCSSYFFLFSMRRSLTVYLNTKTMDIFTKFFCRDILNNGQYIL